MGVLLHGEDGVIPKYSTPARPAVELGQFGVVDGGGGIDNRARFLHAGHFPHDDGGLRLFRVGPEYACRGAKALVDAPPGHPLPIRICDPLGIQVGAVFPVGDLSGGVDGKPISAGLGVLRRFSGGAVVSVARSRVCGLTGVGAAGASKADTDQTGSKRGK